MAAFADLCISSGALRRLRSFTMTVYFLYLKDCMKHIVHLLSDSPIEVFQIYSDFSSKDCTISYELWTQLLLAHGKRLLRISVNRILMSWEVVHSICVECTKLEPLFLFVDPDILVRTMISPSVLLERTHILNIFVRRINWVLFYLSQRL